MIGSLTSWGVLIWRSGLGSHWCASGLQVGYLPPAAGGLGDPSTALGHHLSGQADHKLGMPGKGFHLWRQAPGASGFESFKVQSTQCSSQSILAANSVSGSSLKNLLSEVSSGRDSLLVSLAAYLPLIAWVV